MAELVDALDLGSSSFGVWVRFPPSAPLFISIVFTVTPIQETLGINHFKVQFNIEEADYSEEYNKEINKLRKTAQLKGFRPGKVPKSYVVNRFGKAILSDVVKQMLNTALGETIKEQSILGYPIQTSEPIDIEEFQSGNNFAYTFEYIAIPEFDVKFSDDRNETITKYSVTADEDFKERELRYYKGENSSEIVNLDAVEDTDEGEKWLEVEGDVLYQIEGEEKRMRIAFALEEITDDSFKSALIGKKVGDSVDFSGDSVKSFEISLARNINLGAVPKDIDLESQDLKLEILQIKKYTSPTMDKAFFEKVLQQQYEGEETLEEFTTKFDGFSKGNLANISKNASFEELRKKLIEINNIELPTELLEKIYFMVREERKGEIEPFEQFKVNVKWDIIQTNIKTQFPELEISEQDIISKLLAFDKEKAAKQSEDNTEEENPEVENTDASNEENKEETHKQLAQYIMSNNDQLSNHYKGEIFWEKFDKIIEEKVNFEDKAVSYIEYLQLLNN